MSQTSSLTEGNQTCAGLVSWRQRTFGVTRLLSQIELTKCDLIDVKQPTFESWVGFELMKISSEEGNRAWDNPLESWVYIELILLSWSYWNDYIDVKHSQLRSHVTCSRVGLVLSSRRFLLKKGNPVWIVVLGLWDLTDVASNFEVMWKWPARELGLHCVQYGRREWNIIVMVNETTLAWPTSKSCDLFESWVGFERTKVSPEAFMNRSLRSLRPYCTDVAVPNFEVMWTWPAQRLGLHWVRKWFCWWRWCGQELGLRRVDEGSCSRKECPYMKQCHGRWDVLTLSTANYEGNVTLWELSWFGAHDGFSWRKVTVHET